MYEGNFFLLARIDYFSRRLLGFQRASSRYENIIKKFSARFSNSKKIIELLRKSNSELKKNNNDFHLINQNLTSFKTTVEQNQNELIINLNDVSQQITLKIEDALKNLSKNNQNGPELSEALQEKKGLSTSISLKPRTKLEVVKTINDITNTTSLCFLKDKRLVSAGGKRIVVYQIKSYQPDIIIENPDDNVLSVCGLKNGNLASSGYKKIMIWEIKGKQYKNIRKLSGHSDLVYKIIELKNGKLCSCSYDTVIKIWDDKDYKCIQTLTGHNGYIKSILELNNYLISTDNGGDDGCEYYQYSNDYSYYDGNDDNYVDKTVKSVRIWNKSINKCLKVIEGAYCCSSNGLSKLTDNEIILGGDGELFIINVSSFESKTVKKIDLGSIWSICVMRNNKVILGNDEGIIFCFDPLSTEIISTQRVHEKGINCLIEDEDNKLISSSDDHMINIYG